MSWHSKTIVSTGAALLAFVVGTTLAQALTQEQAVSPSSPTPEEAVAQAVKASNGTYAGDCTSTTAPADLGKICSRFVAERGSLRAYLVGRTFSEFSQWVFVAHGPAGWAPAGAVPYNDAEGAAPPSNVPWPAT